jgi:hypothetical protein
MEEQLKLFRSYLLRRQFELEKEYTGFLQSEDLGAALETSGEIRSLNQIIANFENRFKDELK